jgi:hypothetical protein
MAKQEYKFQYCTFWNEQIPGVVLKDVNSNHSNELWFDPDRSTPQETRAYRLNGSFLCNLKVDSRDLEKPVKGIQNLLEFESKYKGQLNINVTIPFSEYLSRQTQANCSRPIWADMQVVLHFQCDKKKYAQKR